MAKRKKTGGRKRGSQNKKTAALQRAVEQAVGELIEPFEGDGYAFLATVYKNQALPLGVRLDAAKTAIAYERARLAHVAMTTRSLDQLSDEEFFRAWDNMTAFLEQHGRPLLLEGADVDAADASPDAAGRDAGGRDDAQ